MNWILVVVWGGVVGVDASSFPQAMWSRPIVAAAVTGLIFGRPAEGVVIGLVLEIASLVVLPVGASRYPEAGTGAVAAAGAYLGSASAGASPALLLLSVAFGLLWERVGTVSVDALRRWNEWVVAARLADGSVGDRQLEWLHRGSVALDVVRGAVVSGVGVACGMLLLGSLGPIWSAEPEAALGILAVASAAFLGAALSVFGGWTERRLWFTLGVLCGSMLLLAR